MTARSHPPVTLVICSLPRLERKLLEHALTPLTVLFLNRFVDVNFYKPESNTLSLDHLKKVSQRHTGKLCPKLFDFLIANFCFDLDLCCTDLVLDNVFYKK